VRGLEALDPLGTAVESEGLAEGSQGSVLPKYSVKGRQVRVAVAGATGYAGRELIAILARHPQARIVRLMSSGRSQTRSASEAAESFPIERSHPVLRGALGGVAPSALCHPLSVDDLAPSEVDLVFLGTPHETSHQVAPALLERGLRVIDLSGAFRLKDRDCYPRWYGFEHQASGALRKAVYGLPDLDAEAIRKAQLVANPGCYATSIILALAPLLRAGWVDADAGVVCDAKSGASGAGRAPSEKLHFAEINENCRAYGLFSHRHVPEVLQALALEEKNFTFAPHLLPITRGILSTVYARLTERRRTEEVAALFRDFYSRSPLVRVYDSGLPEIQAVAHTHYADLGFALDAGARRLIVVSALDNLGKGAAGQAVENMNLMCGFPQETALA
jgi:N-acetyl-gamma-glutamyl-phosphate reductase